VEEKSLLSGRRGEGEKRRRAIFSLRKHQPVLATPGTSKGRVCHKRKEEGEEEAIFLSYTSLFQEKKERK